MDMDQLLIPLLTGLLRERGDERPLPNTYEKRRWLLRALMNTRPPQPIDPALLALQDQLLQAESAEKAIVEAESLPPCALDHRLSLWQGDITCLKCDAIVNAANPALLGCFKPCHNCIDNVIHSAAGIQLRLACQEHMEERGCPQEAGCAVLTPGFNLPARYVLHTVGPQVEGPLTPDHRQDLAACYQSCMTLAALHHLSTVAFCCISTGVYGFPRREAARIAVRSVRKQLDTFPGVKKVVFNVFLDEDRELYETLLDRPK